MGCNEAGQAGVPSAALQRLKILLDYRSRSRHSHPKQVDFDLWSLACLQ